MTEMTKPLELHEDIVASIVLDGDLSQLSPGQLVAYYYHRCELLELDPGEKPFDLLRLNGKLVLYCTKAGSAALTRKNQIDVRILERSIALDLCIVTAQAASPSGRVHEDIGAVAINGLAGEKLANAMMKAVTKAKRRAVLGLCGQGLLDESEIESIAGAERVSIEQVQHDARALPAAQDDAPKCTGKASAIAEAIRERRAKLANMVGRDVLDVWREVCGRIQAPPHNGALPEPERLTVEHGKQAAELLKRWIAKLQKKAAEESADPDEDPTAEGAP